LKELENSDIAKELKAGIEMRFNEQNKYLITKFERQLYSETKYLGVLIQNQFLQSFDDLKAQFHKELAE